MTLPYYDPVDDPGPDFHGVLKSLGRAADFRIPDADPAELSEIVHGTTVVAGKFAGGVVIAGDRRATSGHLISYRTMKKVFPADRWSGVAIAGAAGPAVEMVKMFQLQLEHYEKVEGHSLSLEGKANQLSQMVRSHLPAAMQGMVVVPIFAGFDQAKKEGRLFAYDVTGGRYEEGEYIASGSGSLFAKTVIKLEFNPDASEDETINLMIKALFTAADDDSATGGPDSIRGIYPVVSVISADGYKELDEADVSARFENLVGDLAEGGAAK